MMQHILTRANFRKLEAWVLTICFGIFIFQLMTYSRGDNRSVPYRFSDYHIQYNYIANYFFPILIQGITFYSALIVLILVIEPRWEKNQSVIETGISLFAIASFTALVTAISDTYLDAWKLGKYGTVQVAYNHIFFDAFMLIAAFTLMYIAYYLIKRLISILYGKINFKKPAVDGIVFKTFVGLVIYILILIFMIGTRFPDFLSLVFAVMVPYSAIIIMLNVLWLIPTSEVKKFFHSSYVWRMVPVVIALDMLATVFFSAAKNFRSDEAAVMFILILMWTAVALLPWSWYLFKNSSDKTQLVTALGKSDASLSFLKSQINPHFLFNALNTLYGTALQENAERTGEGIQKLGDMMRFMLQENMQDKISLTRDIDYLNNYIDLQKLRISRTSDITIETQIEEQINNMEISPMLLIPFVENAFKHGISLQKPSHIKITLQTRENVLYFDVHNSIHIKAENDPEKLKSGIGLMNVKQRLALVYPEKHELIIRENAKEFFIHLTLQLK